MTGYLPPSPQLYPDDMLTDEPEQVLIAELVREAALEGVRDELPHSIAVVVEEMITEGDLTKIYADLYVERHQPEGDRHRRPGQPAQGRRHPRAPARSRRCSARRVYLDLHVRVAKDWQRDPKQLRKLGF